MNTSSSLGISPASSDPQKRIKTFALPGQCFQKGAALSWRRGNQFAIYPRSQNVNKSTDETISKTQDTILNIRQEILLFNPVMRKLVNEANGTFLALQKLAETSKNTDNQLEFLKLSRQYRSIIRVCVESLQEAAEKEQDGVEKNTLHSYITIFYSVECIWHLCEILFIDVIPGDVVLPFLLEWVRFHFPCHEQAASQMLEACERGSEVNAEYWDTVTGMLIQGRIDVVRALLKLHSLADSNEFKLVDNSLRTMPVYSVYGGVSAGEFTISWKHWQAECRAKLSSRVLANQPQLELLMRLMCGEYGAFESIRPRYGSWFDVVGGYVMFTSPWARRRELGAAAAACAGLATTRVSHLDVMVRALCDGDLHQLIHEVQQVCDGGWCAAHLTDMLHRCARLHVLDAHQTDVTTRLRDSLILEYGTLLCEHKSLWPAGLSYLAATTDGLRRAELILERIPVESDAKALRICAEAKKYGLHGVAQTVCAVRGARALSAGRVGGALCWGARARRGSLVRAGAHAALRRYCARGTLPAADLLLSAAGALLAHDAPLLLGKYSEFHRLYNNREFRAAAKLLVSLITSNIAPDYFWDTLLLDTLPLLETEEPVISAEDTYEIMLCLELKSGSLSTEKAELLRLSLARNLARTSLADMDRDE
ncbi:nuclear pore complex protein Nup85 [Aricia agestis]|uniref:nuclear pore complex protein Nup85 n=1 Tax=Aricia agestis TaxID=91739 RepID=UPI001C2092D6|nr:nuclear pore complex protein Nup85 [Aricia agestis]